MTRNARIAVQVSAAVIGFVSTIVVGFAFETRASIWWIATGLCGLVIAVLAYLAAVAVEARDRPRVENTPGPPSTSTLAPGPPRNNERAIKISAAALIILFLAGLSVATGRWMGIGMPLESLARTGKNLVMAPASVTNDGLTLTVEEVESWGGKTTVTMSVTNRTQYGTLFLLPRACRLVLPSGETWAGEVGGWRAQILPMQTAGGIVQFDGEIPLKTRHIKVGYPNIGPPGPESIFVEEVLLKP